MEPALSHRAESDQEQKQTTDGDLSGFGRFLLDLKNSLTNENIRMLTTALDFKPAERDKVDTSEDPGHVFVHSLKEKGIINLKDVSILTKQLKFCGLYGVADDVKRSFDTYNSEARPQPREEHDYEEKKRKFKKELRNKYRKLCGSMKPVPFLRDKYDIAELYVEGGIKFLEEKQIRDKGPEKWTTLNDYKAVITNPLVKSKRRIIDGEPGVGKSTLALRVTSDWYNAAPPMNDVEIMILLHLRQFKNVSNIYAAIKSFLLPKDSSLTEDDIKTILDSSSTLIWLDGYDEYPDRAKEDTDIDLIIRGDMFQEHDVVLTTRTSCLPPDSPPDTQRIRVTGFDNTARQAYIQNVVAHGDAVTAEEISLAVNNNPIPDDLSRLPLFFVMISHMAHERKVFQNLNTATEFVRHVVVCFLSHEQIRETGMSQRTSKRPITDHSRLDKIAFEGLSGDSQQITWERNELRDKIGGELYDEYVRVGILTEEEAFDDDVLDYKTEARFFHKLFLEWFAAHYLAKKAALPEVEFEAWPSPKFGHWFGTGYQTAASEIACSLKSLDPHNLQFMYRFACGLNRDAAVKIIEHLGQNDSFDTCTLLCMSEWGGSLKKISQIVSGICSRPIRIKYSDSVLLEKSTVELLECASSLKIPVFRVALLNCLEMGLLPTRNLRLKKSQISLPISMPTLQELFIWEEGIEITDIEMDGLLHYISTCPGLKRLYLYQCMLPRLIKVNGSLSVLKSRGVKVGWSPGSKNHCLNLESGQWEYGSPDSFGHLFSGWFDLTPMTDEDYSRAREAFHIARREAYFRSKKKTTHRDNAKP